MIRVRRFALAGAGALIFAGSAAAQFPKPKTPEQRAADTVHVDPRSPRAAIEDFLALTRRGQYEAAGRYMGPNDRAQELASRLRAVLDQRMQIDISQISPLAAGDTADRLPATIEQIGSIRGSNGELQPVQLIQNARTAELGWQFSTGTVDHINAWYVGLGAQWLRSRMPDALLQPGPLGVDRWQWLSLGLLIPFAMVIGWFAGRITASIARRAAHRTKTTLDDRLIERTGGPLLALWGVFAYRALVELASLSITAESIVSLIVRALSVALTTWIVVRVTYVLEEELPVASSAGQNAELRSFAPLIGRVLRIFVLALGAIGVVAQFGYSVTTVLGAVGIGGIALAFAAQKTLEHPFGSIAIGIDRPIRIGDWVKIGEVEGEVEAIGLRSTRIRTLERTLVIFPNGRLAEMQMENFGVRDRILLRTRLGLSYETSVEKLKAVREGIERVLTDHPLIWPDRIVVRMKAFGPATLDFDVISWVATTDYNVFRAAREEIFFRFMDVIAAEGCSLAYPTQTLYVRAESRAPGAENGGPAPAQPPRPKANLRDGSWLAELPPDDQFEPGPDVVDGADLHIDKA